MTAHDAEIEATEMEEGMSEPVGKLTIVKAEITAISKAAVLWTTTFKDVNGKLWTSEKSSFRFNLVEAEEA